jgi:hypothetical protein
MHCTERSRSPMSGIQSHPNRGQTCVPLIRCIAWWARTVALVFAKGYGVSVAVILGGKSMAFRLRPAATSSTTSSPKMASRWSPRFITWYMAPGY